MIASCSEDNNGPKQYSDIPTLDYSKVLGSITESLRPVRLQLLDDTLYVCYVGLARIDLYDLNLELVRTIELTDPEPVTPTAFYITDSSIFVCDHAKRVVVVYGRDGSFETSYGTFPDQKTGLSPFNLTYYGGVLYVGDINIRNILAISMVDATGVTEKGELILTFPLDSTIQLGFPSALMVTPDGRLLVGDAATGSIDAFTCDGRFVYSFDKVPSASTMGPQAFAIDNIIDPSIQDTSSFDPSGVRAMGRIHVADANNSAIHLFNPLGRYIASYTGDSELMKPSSIAIDRSTSRIYVADPAAGRIWVFSY